MSGSGVMQDLEVMGTFIRGFGLAARTDVGYDGEEYTYYDSTLTRMRVQRYSVAAGSWATESLASVQTLPIPASGWVSPATNGAADGVVDGTNHSYATKDFITGTEQHIDYDFTITDEYAGGNITVEFTWTAASGSGTVSWELNVASGANSDVLDAAKTDVGSATDTLITAGDIHKIELTWSTSLPTAGDLVTIRVSRDVAADNLGVDAQLKEVKFSWST